jgi:hypothetical protein
MKLELRVWSNFRCATVTGAGAQDTTPYSFEPEGADVYTQYCNLEIVCMQLLILRRA